LKNTSSVSLWPPFGPRFNGANPASPALAKLELAQKAEPSLSFAQLAELAKKEFDVQVHPRSTRTTRFSACLRMNI
jgi:hypothetical protein